MYSTLPETRKRGDDRKFKGILTIREENDDS